MTRGRSHNGEYAHKPGHHTSDLYSGDGAATYDPNVPLLSPDEQAELARYETVIDRGLKTFYEVGSALTAIRDGRLYRESHATFEEYCRKRWQMSRQRAFQFIESSSVISNLSTIVDTLPSTESQARPLTSLPPEKQVEAWQAAVETAPNGRVTAAHVQSVVDEIKTPPVRVTYGANEDDYQPEVPEVQVDETWEQAKLKPQGNGRYSENETEWKVGGRGAKVKTPAGHIGTVAFAAGRFVWVDTVNGRKQYDAEKLIKIEDEVDPTPPAADPAPNYKRDNQTTRAANELVAQPFDLCQTPAYALDPLLPYLGWSMPSTVWEAAAGEGLLVEALYDGGWTEAHVIQSDIQTGQNFFDYEPDEWDILVTNPPFSLKLQWLERCYALGKPFALLLPVDVIGTKTAQALMQAHGFELMLLSDRVDFKMPNKGWNGGGAQFSVLWLCWNLLPEKIMFGDIEAGKKAFKAEIGGLADDNPE